MTSLRLITEQDIELYRSCQKDLDPRKANLIRRVNFSMRAESLPHRCVTHRDCNRWLTEYMKKRAEDRLAKKKLGYTKVCVTPLEIDILCLKGKLSEDVAKRLKIDLGCKP